MKFLPCLLAALCIAVPLQAQTNPGKAKKKGAAKEAPLVTEFLAVKPYLQPGNGTSLTGKDVKVVAWMTGQTPGAEFTVEYGPTASYGQTAKIERTTLNLSTNLKFFKYAATLTELPFNSQIHYRVKQDGKPITTAAFTTRKTADQTVNFIVVGDTADGNEDQKKVAFEMSKVKPEFMLIVGDIVYSQGKMSEYLRKFWPVYNNGTQVSPTAGAGPFMQSTIIYPVLGNHDVGATNLTPNPDGFAAFYFYHPPLNGPKSLDFFTPIGGTPEAVSAFKAAAGTTYPGLCFYSFDNGPGHFLCLDANKYVLPLDPKLLDWIKDDLTKSTAKWKFVFFHQPGFNSSLKHNDEQRMRLLAPLFESCGVDVVLAGHVHNYQRSKPLTFVPTENKLNARGLVPGKLTMDEEFDGQKNTRPKGIIYVVTGGGGARLYDTEFTGDPSKWTDPFTSKFISDRHSFSFIELSPEKFTLHQIDEAGKEVDTFSITKAGK
jgi:predicted phosphodiesterase